MPIHQSFRERLSIILLLLLCLSACNRREKAITPAFYHWQTKFELSRDEIQYLQEMDMEKLYVKFFDVDWDYTQKRAIPKAVLKSDKTLSTFGQIVPTIFITNRTFLQMPAEQVPELAKKTQELIDILGTGQIFKEIQLDCDWSLKTRAKYFSFLRELRRVQANPATQLSATIRLHQLKHFKSTGIPPVDRGMLMVYNVGEVDEWLDNNSILSTETVNSYLIPFREYPLELDIALPIFAWGVVFRNGKMIRLINNLRKEDLTDTSIVSKIGQNRFQLKKSTYIKASYLYRGDKIRVESIAIDLLDETATSLAEFIHADQFSVSFYHLDSTTIKFYSHEQLQGIIQKLAR